MRIVLLGKPGSGKGTQARTIATDQRVCAVSTGDLIRKAIATGSDLGKRFRGYTDRGHLVPDDLVLAIVEERLALPDCADGFLLDGFPRTIPQARGLDGWLEAHGGPLNVALNINVPDSALIERAIGRRFCPNDNQSFHTKFAPPKVEGVCDFCGAALQQRADDRRDVVMARIAEYKSKTAPLIDFYGERGILRHADGLGTPGEVAERIAKCLGAKKS